MRLKRLSLLPEYNLIVVRDITPPANREAADEAATRSGTEIAASSGEAVFIYAAQRTIPVQLTVKVYSQPRVADDGDDWDGDFRFEVDFPSGVVHFGDLSHRVDSVELPGGPGRYSVAVHYAGREAADHAVREIFNLPDPEQQELQIQRKAGLERYLFVVTPTASAGQTISSSGSASV
jgi:hypothetical protein